MVSSGVFSSKELSSVALGGMKEVLLVEVVDGLDVVEVVNLLKGLLLFVPNSLLLASSVVDSSVVVVDDDEVVVSVVVEVVVDAVVVSSTSSSVVVNEVVEDVVLSVVVTISVVVDVDDGIFSTSLMISSVSTLRTSSVASILSLDLICSTSCSL